MSRRFRVSQPTAVNPDCPIHGTQARAAEDAADLEDYTPPDPYRAAIAKRLQAEATHESQFAEQYQAERAKEFAAQAEES